MIFRGDWSKTLVVHDCSGMYSSRDFAIVFVDSETSTLAAINSSSNDAKLDQLRNVSQPMLDTLLAKAIARLLIRAGKGNRVKLVVPKYKDQALLRLVDDLVQIISLESSTEDESDSFVLQITDYLLSTKDDFPDPLSLLKAPGGIVLFVCSIVGTRGVSNCKLDMDDQATCHLTGQFGHCSQELINILLCGKCVSNVFDNEIDMGGGYVVKGIGHKSSIGYLTQLEALRYCEVGSYLKTPFYPIWVIGSSSHFSVLFGADFTSIESSKSDELLEQCRRAFRTSDPDSNGFISVSSLTSVLNYLDPSLVESIGGKTSVNTLGAKLDSTASGIILWDDFWKSCSRLMTGASLQNILLDENDINKGNKLCSPGNVGALNSDEKLARELQNKFNNEVSQSSATRYTGKSDEELARELQAQFDGHSSLPPLEPWTSTVNIDNTSTAAVDDECVTLDSSSIAVSQVQKTNFNQVSMGDTFSLHYYNGLRGGTFQKFDVTRLTSEEAVGASIALKSTYGSGVGHSSSNTALEDVVRTRWPCCTFNWHGNTPPAID